MGRFQVDKPAAENSRSAAADMLNKFFQRQTLKAPDPPAKSAALLGLAFDNDDGHTRLTRGDNFVLYGGSHQTHAVMQETA